MNRKPTRTPADPWEWFSGAIYHLGKSVVLKIWGNISERTLERWSASRSDVGTQSITKNPVVMLGIMLEKLMEKGRSEFARSIVDYLASIVNCTLSCSGDIIPDKDNLSDELLDDLPVIADFHQAILRREPETTVREKYRLAVTDLEEDFAAYLQNKGDGEK